MRKVRGFVKLITLIMIIFFAYTACNLYLFSLQNDEEHTDAAIVLGAAAWYGKPSPVLKERLNHAIELYKQGKVDYLIFTGGTADGEIKSEARTSMEYAIEQGVDEKKIIIEEESYMTQENLEFAIKAAEETGHDFDTYTLVSDPLHMKRAVLLAEEMGLNVQSSPTQTSAYQTMETKFPFFIKEWLYYSGYVLSSPFQS
ncbi:MAG: YdcF family protein [Bacillus sp. (in: firmicutes)]